MSISVNESAPDFTLKDGEGRDWRLSDQRGRVVVLLFYPGDETPVCRYISLSAARARSA